MAVDTDLQMRPDRDAKKVAFVDSGNRLRLHYGNLRAWDASGKDLPATIEAGNGEITLRIEDSAATYPVTIDPLMYTETKLTASDATPGEAFGSSIAISRDGDTAVVGAFLDGEAGRYSGSAYVFVRVAGIWIQQQKLIASDAQRDQVFGASVAIDSDTLVVGATHGLYPLFAPGSAYVFLRIGGVWIEQQKLMPDDSASYDAFGASVAITGDTIVVGANDTDMSAPVWPPGSAYIFRLTGGVYTQEAKLTPSDGMLQDMFGSSVAISEDGNTVVVGAPHGHSPSAEGSGAAYVFQHAGISWTEEAKLTASDAAGYAYFGRSIGIGGGTIVVGAPYAGAVYVFVPISGFWSELQKLTTLPEDRLGASVAINGDTIVAGAPADGTRPCAAYVFQNSAIGWMLGAKLTASDSDPNCFGAPVSISGDTNVVGVGAQTNYTAAGAAYVYTQVQQQDFGFLANPSMESATKSLNAK